MRLMGQAGWRASQKVEDNAAIPEEAEGYGEDWVDVEPQAEPGFVPGARQRKEEARTQQMNQYMAMFNRNPRPRLTRGTQDLFAPWWTAPPMEFMNDQGEEQVQQVMLSRLVALRKTYDTALLVDIGAYSNLTGDAWLTFHAQRAADFGHTSSQKKLDKPMNVSGVGKQGQSAQ